MPISKSFQLESTRDLETTAKRIAMQGHQTKCSVDVDFNGATLMTIKPGERSADVLEKLEVHPAIIKNMGRGANASRGLL